MAKEIAIKKNGRKGAADNSFLLARNANPQHLVVKGYGSFKAAKHKRIDEVSKNYFPSAIGPGTLDRVPDRLRRTEPEAAIPQAFSP